MERRSTADLAKALKSLEIEGWSLQDDPRLLQELDDLVHEAKEVRAGVEQAAVVS